MTVTQARQLTLHDVETRFQLEQVAAAGFFSEWLVSDSLTEAEQRWLDQVKTDFLALAKYALHEEIVKLVVLAPVLSLAGLCRPPFLPKAEDPVEIALADGDELIRGRVDVLVLHEQFWVTVVESKRHGIDASEGIPQALLYMLTNPHPQSPSYGLVTNGSHFVFLKLIKGERPRYALSDEFSLRRRGNELYSVVAILRQLGAQAVRAA